MKKIAPPVFMIDVVHDFLTFCHGVGLMRARTRARLWTVFWKENLLFIFRIIDFFQRFSLCHFCKPQKFNSCHVTLTYYKRGTFKLKYCLGPVLARGTGLFLWCDYRGQFLPFSINNIYCAKQEIL